jgi:hypothetical protein
MTVGERVYVRTYRLREKGRVGACQGRLGRCGTSSLKFLFFVFCMPIYRMQYPWIVASGPPALENSLGRWRENDF